MIALVTGSGGLVGSECVRRLCAEGWRVIGVDNDSRRSFFGAEASTEPVVRELTATWPEYRHYVIDIRDREAVREAIRDHRPDFIVHTAAQPSHDKAAAIPFEDFDINASGTLNLLAAVREFVADSPVCFTSTNKVYGDRPNYLPFVETPTRWDYADPISGISEQLSIDQSLHSLFGASKLAADILCQEYGRYFGMPVGIFRAGCLTGARHAAVELHGYLNYIVRCAVTGTPYTIRGYKGKQVRDQLHCADVVSAFPNSTSIRVQARSTTLAAVVRTVYRLLRLSICCLLTALVSNIHWTSSPEQEITSATYRTLVSCNGTIHAGE